MGPTPNALTSSLSPPLASSPPPASLRLKWSQESNTATMSGAAGEKRSEMGRERATEEGEKEQEESTNTSLSPLLSATHKKMSFWLDTKEPLYPPPLSSMFLLSAFLCYAFFFSLPSSSPYNFPSFFPLLSLKEGYFSANDLIRGAIWNSITADFIVATAIWIEGQRDGWRQRCASAFQLYFLWPLNGFYFFSFFFNTNNNNFISVLCFVQTVLLKCFTEED